MVGLAAATSSSINPTHPPRRPARFQTNSRCAEIWQHQRVEAQTNHKLHDSSKAGPSAGLFLYDADVRQLLLGTRASSRRIREQLPLAATAAVRGRSCV